MQRAIRIALGFVAAVALLAVAAYLVVTRTSIGRERIRATALNALRSHVNGHVSIGRIEGNVLKRFALIDVAITDSAGQPFLHADTIRATIATRSLLSRHIVLSDLALTNAVLRLDKPPSGLWNYKRIFPTKPAAPLDTIFGWGDWISVHRVSLTNGALVVRLPWRPDTAFTKATRDSAVAAALAGKSYPRVIRVPGGFQQVLDFRSIDGQLSDVVLAMPESDAVTGHVDRMDMIATPFEGAPFDVRRFAGNVRVTPDTVRMPDLALQLPASRVSGSLLYLTGTGDTYLELTGQPVALADLHGLYPLLPDTGGGSLRLHAVISPAGPSEYVATGIDLSVRGAGVRGTFGLRIDGDTVRFHDTQLSFRQFPTALAERVSRRVTLPVHGTFTGTASLQGPLTAMHLVADGTFNPARHEPFQVAARGGIGAREHVQFQALAVHAGRMPADFVRDFIPGLPLDGNFTADATLSGSPAATITGPFTVTHAERGTMSRAYGVGTLRLTGGLQYSADVHLAPVQLAVVRDLAPNANVRGAVTGTARLRGTRNSLQAHADLVVPGGGGVVANGSVDFGGTALGYNATADLRHVDLRASMPSFPATALNGTASLRGAGTDPSSLNARLTANLRDLSVDSTSLQSVVVRANARNGEVTLDTLDARSAFGVATVRGRFGLDRQHNGTLTYAVTLRDIGGLDRWIATGDTTAVAARPAVQERLRALVESTDSTRRARAVASQTVAQLATKQGAAQSVALERTVPRVPALRRDSLSGSVRITGTLAGNVRMFTARGTAVTPGVVWNGNEIRNSRVDFAYAGLGASGAELRATVSMDSLRTAGFAFDSTRITGSYRSGEGNVDVAMFPGDTSMYRVRADYLLHAKEGEVHLRDITLRFDSVTWVSTHPSAINWKGRGLVIDSLALHTTRGGGSIFVNGELPDGNPAALDVAVDSMRIAPWLTLLQSDIPGDGLLSFTGRVDGTRLTPHLQGRLTLVDARYAGAPFPEFRSVFTYDRQRLSVDGAFERSNGYRLALLHGVLPVDLALTGSVPHRLLDAPLQVTLAGDSIPLAPLGQLTDALTGVQGWAHGALGVAGTIHNPRLEGSMAATLSRVGIAATGVAYQNVAAGFHMSSDTLVIDSLVGRSGGVIRGQGGIDLTDLTHPVLDMRVTAGGARVLNNEKGELFADSRLHVRGPLDSLDVTGATTITRGVVYLPKPEEFNLISTGDPTILAALDSVPATALAQAVSATRLRNMDIDVNLIVERGTWARSDEANVELYGNVEVRRHRGAEGYSLSGTLYTGQGEYMAYGKRFTVTRGSARFTGDPSINPAIQVLAVYQVRQAGRAPFDINVILGGTMRRPSLTLESDAQPTLSQSDLLSFLAFGQSTTTLLQFEGDGLQGGGQAGSSLAGNVAALATRQLAGVALGAMVDQVQTDLVATTGADVVDITPADLPPELSMSSLGSLVRGTEVRLGKYTDRRTFVTAQIRPTLAIPGASVERWYGEHFRLRTSFETRYLPQQPSLTAGLRPQTLQVFGALMRWSIHW